MHLDKRYASDRLCILKLNLIINGLKFCINVSRIVSASGISFIYIYLLIIFESLEFSDVDIR